MFRAHIIIVGSMLNKRIFQNTVDNKDIADGFLPGSPCKNLLIATLRLSVFSSINNKIKSDLLIEPIINL